MNKWVHIARQADWRFLVFIFILSLSTFACSMDDINLAGYHTCLVNNDSEYLASIYVDGSMLIQVVTHSSNTMQVQPGSRNIHVVFESPTYIIGSKDFKITMPDDVYEFTVNWP